MDQANTAINKSGYSAPASVKLPYWSTYLWLKNGKTYRQEAPVTGSQWVEITAGGGGGGGGGEHTKPSQPDRSVQYNSEEEFTGTSDFVYEPDFERETLTEGQLVIGTEYTIELLLGGGIPDSITNSDAFPPGSGFAPGLTTGVNTFALSGGGDGLIVDVTANGSGTPTDVVINTPGSGYGANDIFLLAAGGFNSVWAVGSVIGGDDFLNVGAPSNTEGVTFTATGTTPTDWSNASQLSYEMEIGATVVVRNGGVDTPFVKFPEGFNKGTLSADDLQFADRTWFLPPRSGEISLIEDASTSNILWVDVSYGNDSTAIPHNSLLPYRTIMAAITEALAGDLVVIRTGDYLESVILKNGVNIHCMTGVTFGSTSGVAAITDNGESVTCRVTGYGTVDRRFQNTTVYFTGITSNIYCEFYQIKGAGSKFSWDDNPANTSTIYIKCVDILETAFNNIMNTPASAVGHTWTLDVSGVVELISSGAKAFLSLQSPGCYGTYNFKINEVYFTAGSHPQAGTLIFGTNNQGQQSPIINMEIDKITNLHDSLPNPATWAFIHTGASDNGLLAWDLTVKINQPFELKRRSLLSINGNNTGISRFSGDVTGNEYQPLIYNSSANHKVYVHDSYLKKPNTGTDLNNIVTTVGDNSYVEYKNVIFHKDSLATDTGALIVLDGASATTVFKDCEMYLTGAGATGLVCDGPVGEADVYFKNTRSTIDNGVNVVDTAVVSGFIPNDINLTDYKI
jgi:hypothetical protein